jgi:hypothetical protein
MGHQVCDHFAVVAKDRLQRVVILELNRVDDVVAVEQVPEPPLCVNAVNEIDQRPQAQIEWPGVA